MSTGAEIIAALTPAERRRMRKAEASERADRRSRPLAYAHLWHSPRTSQRTAAQVALRSGVLLAFILGGNRAGKTEFAAQLAVAVAQGRDHPDTIRWAERNSLDISRIPCGPGVVVVGSGDSGDSRRVMRPKIAKYQPLGSKWRNRDGQGDSEVELPGGGLIVFKSVDQGRDGWQGFSARLIIFDEEPLDLGVVSESLMRIADDDGWIVLSMTPLSGWTSLLSEHLRDHPSPDAVMYQIHGTDNPYMTQEKLQAIYRKYGTHERAARERGEITALEGRVYVDWDRSLHVVPHFTPPAEWRRFAGVDFGTRNPTAILWLALDPKDDVLHVYREHYQAEQTNDWHVERYVARSAGEEIEWVVADCEDLGARMTWSNAGVQTIPSSKGAGSVRAGISAVASRLAPDAEGRPHLFVHDNCQALIREIESYVWATTKTKRDLPDEPLKKQDHALDALRYAVWHLSRLGGLYEVPPPEEERQAG